MSRPFGVTNKQAAEMTKLRDLGVPIARIARQFGVATETVRKHTSEADRIKLLERDRIRHAEYSMDPAFIARRRETARAYAAKRRAEAPRKRRNENVSAAD